MRNVFGTHVYIAEGMHGKFSIHNRVYETYGRDSWARLWPAQDWNRNREGRLEPGQHSSVHGA